jgi:hypothetical protein
MGHRTASGAGVETGFADGSGVGVFSEESGGATVSVGFEIVLPVSVIGEGELQADTRQQHKSHRKSACNFINLLEFINN